VFHLSGGYMNRSRVLLLFALLQSVLAFTLSRPPTPEAGIVHIPDFIIQVTAGRVADSAGYGELYSVQAQIEAQSDILGRQLSRSDLLPFNHPPYLVPVLKPVSRLSFDAAFTLWIMASLLIFLVGSLALSHGYSRLGVEQSELFSVRLSLLTFAPVIFSVLHGQDTFLLFLGVAGWLVLFSSDRFVLSGLALSLATIRPHLALTLVIPFLFARRGTAAGFVLGTAVLSLLSYLALGSEGIEDYARIVQLTGADAVVSGRLGMPNLLGFLSRAVGKELPAGLFWYALLAWVVLIGGSSAWWAKLGNRLTPIHLSLLVFGTVFLVPHIHLHDFAILAVPQAMVAKSMLTRKTFDWNRPLLTLCVSSFAFALISIRRVPIDLCIIPAALLLAAPIISELRHTGSTTVRSAP